MASVIEVDVKVSPGLDTPVDITPYLRDAMGPATAEVKQSADAALAQFFRPRGNWARRQNKVGYGPLHGSVSVATVSAKGAGAAGFVRTFVFYARFLERGASAHALAAKPGRALAIRHLALAALAIGEVVKSVVRHVGTSRGSDNVGSAVWFPLFAMFAAAPLYLYDRPAARKEGPLLELASPELGSSGLRLPLSMVRRRASAGARDHTSGRRA